MLERGRDQHHLGGIRHAIKRRDLARVGFGNEQRHDADHHRKMDEDDQRDPLAQPNGPEGQHRVMVAARRSPAPGSSSTITTVPCEGAGSVGMPVLRVSIRRRPS
jgi:hypothetical protein